MNRFAECGSPDQVIRQAVGAGSRCWTETGIYDTDEAIKIDEAWERVGQLLSSS